MSAAGFDIPGYELQRRLGEGGMATVFLAVQKSLDRRVAIKIMRRVTGDTTEEKRFINEGRTLARLPHPNIVGVYDIVQNEDINYIAMEFLEGGILNDRISEGLTLFDSIGIVVQLADALQFAHDHGIIHRDLKPANILFRNARTPVLTDFGIARLQSMDMTRLTQTGMMTGTPAYMSPEQAQGGSVDGRSDQYSLGVLFYEMLTKQVPFVGETPMQVAFAHVHNPPPALPLRFEFLQPIMSRMLAKDPKNRFPDLKSFAREFRNLLAESKELEQQLRFTANQTVAERLRALGFSDEQIHSGQHQKVALSIKAEPGEQLPPEMVARQLLEGSELKLEPIQERHVHYTSDRPQRRDGGVPQWLVQLGTVLITLILAMVAYKLFVQGA